MSVRGSLRVMILVRIGVRVRGRIRSGGNCPGGNCPRTAQL